LISTRCYSHDLQLKLSAELEADVSTRLSAADEAHKADVAALKVGGATAL